LERQIVSIAAAPIVPNSPPDSRPIRTIAIAISTLSFKITAIPVEVATIAIKVPPHHALSPIAVALPCTVAVPFTEILLGTAKERLLSLAIAIGAHSVPLTVSSAFCPLTLLSVERLQRTLALRT
jgi:hypothetical protein